MKVLSQEAIAKVLLINEKNQALILTLGEHRARPEKSYTMDLPGGTVEPGENESIAAAREIAEETGIEIDTSCLLLAYSKTQLIPDENKSVTKHLFIAYLESTPSVTLSWEHASYSWIKLEYLHTAELKPFYQEAVEHCFSNGLLSK